MTTSTHAIPFTPTTAAIIRDAWIARRDRTDPQPIREHWRAWPELRGLIGELMTAPEQGA